MPGEATLEISMQDLARRWVAAQPAVAAFISLMVRDFHDAQDVLQEVAAAVLSRNVIKTGIPISFDAWVIGIARHKAVDWHRRTSVDRMVFNTEALDEIAAAYEQLTREYGPRQEALEHCLRRVVGKSRRLLEMRYQDDLTPTEIAQRVGSRDGAVKVALHRIRMALRDCIEHRLDRQEVAG
jgi:RNA polymerase sigma-70 factor (ECF subfamily)